MHDQISAQNYMGDMVNDLEKAGTTIAMVTISNTRLCHELKPCRAPKVLLLKPAHIQYRLKFSRNHLDDPEEDWENFK